MITPPLQIDRFAAVTQEPTARRHVVGEKEVRTGGNLGSPAERPYVGPSFPANSPENPARINRLPLVKKTVYTTEPLGMEVTGRNKKRSRNETLVPSVRPLDSTRWT